MKKILINNIHIIFFIIFFLFQFQIYGDYGFSWDEKYSRLNGLVSFNYIVEKLSLKEFLIEGNIPKLSEHTDREYGSLFEIFTVFIERGFNINETKQIYLTRHFLNSLFFFLASIYFFLTLDKFYSKSISLIGFLIFISHPRIFAHSFYNSKDLIFLCFLCISNYYLISFLIKKNFLNLFLFSFFLSMTIGTRVMGLIIPFLFIFFFSMENFNKKKINDSLTILIFLTFTITLTIIFWPFLWDNPFNILDSFSSMSKYDWKGSVYFNGNYYSGKYLPWYYLPMTILITTPILYIVLFIFGFFYITKQSLKNLLNIEKAQNLWSNKEELFCLYSMSIVLLTITLIIELNSTLYNGWRQVFFIYPSLIFVSIFGLNMIIKNFNFKKIIYLIIGLYLIFNFNWLYQNHPYQYTYYNSFVNNTNIKKFELDYWGLSNLDIMKKLNELEPNKKNYRIYVFSSSPYNFSLNLMNDSLSKKYMFVDNLDEADYIFTNHFYQNKDPIIAEKYLKENFNLIYEIKSDNIRINSIYKK